MRDLRWTSGTLAASAHNNCPFSDILALYRQYGTPDGYHPIYRDGLLLGYAPDDDDCSYDITDIILLPEA